MQGIISERAGRPVAPPPASCDSIADHCLTRGLDEVDESIIPFHGDLVTTPALTGPFGVQVRKEARRWM